MSIIKNNNLKPNKNNRLHISEALKAELQLIDFPIEFLDLCYVMKNGAEKHGKDTWADEDNVSMQHKNNHASMSRHLSEHYCGLNQDWESGLSPLLHLATRALMSYTRKKRGIKDE